MSVVADQPAGVYQTPWELETAAMLCRSMKPKRVLEVGAMEGGSLLEWMRAKPEVVCVVDDEMRNAETWQMWADTSGIKLYLELGKSQWPDTIFYAGVRGPYDWIFIDADHSYEAVKADWENYGPMVAPGGAVAFHDIYARPGYGVSHLWWELKTQPGARTMEIGQRMEPQVHGIGVIWP